MRSFLGIVVHVFTRIDGIEGVSCRYERSGLGCGFEVVCIRSKAKAPPFLEYPPHGIIHHLLGGTARALVFPH